VLLRDTAASATPLGLNRSPGARRPDAVRLFALEDLKELAQSVLRSAEEVVRLDRLRRLGCEDRRPATPRQLSESI
jgi:hypothetical protein